jgi:uncharacterized protein (DUF1778 family)
MDRRHTLFVRLNRAEQEVVRRAAAIEQLRISEYVRGVVRRDAERLLGAAQLRTLLAEFAITRPTP